MKRVRARITSLGLFVPEQVVTNADLEKRVDTSDEWIRTRTGIEERRFAAPGTPTSELALRASRQALERRGIGPDEIDVIVVATVTADMHFPATACILQEKLGAKRAWGFDISAACSGFVYALTIGAQFVENGNAKKVLVIGADVMTSILNFQDRSTCVLFGDGAGAVLLEPGDDGTGLLDFAHEVDGSGGPFLNMPGGGSAFPPTHENIDRNLHFIHQDGGHVFKYAVRKMAEASKGLLDKNGVSPEELDLFVAHQANLRIINAAQERLGLPDSKVVKNIAKYGNTTAATIPLLWDECARDGRLQPGDLVLLVAFGAGMTWGASLVRA